MKISIIHTSGYWLVEENTSHLIGGVQDVLRVIETYVTYFVALLYPAKVHPPFCLFWLHFSTLLIFETFCSGVWLVATLFSK